MARTFQGKLLVSLARGKSLPRRCVLGLLGLLLASVATANRADAAYTVWQCYAGQWSASYSNIADYNRAVYFRDANISAGFPSVITTGSKPTATCTAPAKKCLYYAKVKYQGQTYQLGGYLTSAAAYSAYQNINKAYGGKVTYLSTFQSCQ